MEEFYILTVVVATGNYTYNTITDLYTTLY